MTDKPRILFVDDEEKLLRAARRGLAKGYDVSTALSGAEGLDRVSSEGPFAVVISDMNMPGMTGVQFLARVRKAAPDTVRMMLTAYAEIGVAADAVNDGHVFRFLTKPCPRSTLLTALEAAVEQYRLIRAERELLDKTLHGSLRVLSQVLSMANPTAFGQALRAQRIARQLLAECPSLRSWDMEVAAMLSQIGCVSVPEELLGKVRRGAPLSDEEKCVVGDHPMVASRLLGAIPRMERVARAIRYQDKRYGGGGWPEDEVSGEQIPLGGRLLKLVLDYDRLLVSGDIPVQALAELESRAGWYDPVLLEGLRRAIHRDRRFNREQLRIHLLREGMTLDEDLWADPDTLLMGRGTELTPPLLTLLNNWERLGRLEGLVWVLIPIPAPSPDDDDPGGDHTPGSDWLSETEVRS